jgi:hypothetical protein
MRTTTTKQPTERPTVVESPLNDVRLLLRRIRYYMSSFVALLFALRSPLDLVKPLLGTVGSGPINFELRQPRVSFKVRGPLDA